MKHGALALAAAALAVSAAAAAPAPAPTLAGTYVYTVRHETLGEIGTHAYTFRREGDAFVVVSKIRLLARILFVPVRRYEADRREVWKGGRLVAYESLTDDDGKKLEVHARAAGDKLVVEGPKGRAEAPGDVFPTSAWSPEFVRHRLVMDTETGEIKSITVKDMGEETVEAAGRAVRAHKYVISGGLKRVLWFDRDGVWVKMRLERDGDLITVTLKHGPSG